MGKRKYVGNWPGRGRAESARSGGLIANPMSLAERDRRLAVERLGCAIRVASDDVVQLDKATASVLFAAAGGLSRRESVEEDDGHLAD